MPQTKIMQDRHGPYVRADGRLYRPEHPVAYSHLPDGTGLAAGTLVKVKATATVGRVSCGDVQEVWHSHGCYFGPGGTKIPSEQLYRPGPAQNWARQERAAAAEPSGALPRPVAATPGRDLLREISERIGADGEGGGPPSPRR